MKDFFKLLEKGRFSEAKELAEKQKSPENIFYKGIIFYNMGNLEKAEKLLENYINLKSDNPEAYYYLGNIYLEKNILDKAEKFLKKL